MCAPRALRALNRNNIMLKLIKITESLFQQAMQVSINGGKQDQLGLVVRSYFISPALLPLLIRVRQSCWRYTKPKLKILEDFL